MRRGVDDLVDAVVLEPVRVVRRAPRATRAARPCPGNPSASRSSWTSGVMTPRSSAITGSGPSASSAARKSDRPGPRRPPAVPRGLGAGRDRPVPREPAEVVDPEDVDEVEHAAHPLDPPAVAVRGHRLPVVERVAPQLAEVVEAVRRGARDDLVERQEELGVGAMVAAVGRDVDRHVADDRGRPARPRSARSASHSRSNRTCSSTASPPANAAQSSHHVPAAPGTPAASLGSTRASGSASSPPHDANADADAYGEPNSSGGLSGRTCHQRAPAAASQSTKANASGPEPAARQRGGMELDAD